MDFIAQLSEWGYIGLFTAALLAGSILPFCSEAVLAILLAAGYNIPLSLTVATAGNFIGGMTCYYIGRLGKLDWIEKYLRIKPEKLAKAELFLQKGPGGLTAFLSFLPAGETIVVGLGYMRANIWITGISMLAGKFLRYYLIFVGVDFFI
ncbi:MAG: DedA family protein [Bacteroidales bacterium]